MQARKVIAEFHSEATSLAMIITAATEPDAAVVRLIEEALMSAYESGLQRSYEAAPRSERPRGES